jgi:hypothetical protein
MAGLQPYVSNTPLVVAKNLRFVTEAGIPVTELLPIGMVGTTVADSPTTGYISRIGAVLSEQIDLYNVVNNTLIQYQIDITNLDNRVSALEISGTTVPSVNGYCYNESSPILVTDMVELLTQDLCEYKPVFGTPSALTLAILAEGSAVLNTLPAFSQNSVMAGLTGWVTTPLTVADTINNLWVSYLDSRAGIQKVIDVVTPSCAQVIIDYQPVYDSSTQTINVFFSGYSFIPTGYLDGGSTVTITDGLGGIYNAGFNIVNQSTTVEPLALSISGSALTLDLAYYTVNIQSNVANAAIGTTCIKNVLKNTILQGTPPANIASFVATSYSIEIAQSTSVLPIVTGLSSTPRYVDINALNAYTASLLITNPYYLLYSETGVTLEFTTPTLDLFGTFSINILIYNNV